MNKIFFFIIFLFSTTFILSQNEVLQNFDTYTQTNFSTPEVSSFEKVSLIPNDLSTGRLNLNIPIYTIKTGRLNYPIRLSYNSAGVKVNNLASEVGLGWSLSKTVISRQIVDANDFDNLGTQYFDPIGGGFGSTLNDPEFAAHWNAKNWTGPKMGFFLKEQLNFKANSNVKQVDEMPDIYSLSSANGFSTKFYFSDINTPVELKEGNSVIDAYKNKRSFQNPAFVESTAFPDFPMYDFEKIEVISNQGIKYTFEDYDVSITTVVSVPGETYPEQFTVPQVSAWHISKIEDLLTGDKIEFEYETYNADPVTEPFDLYDINAGPDALIRFKSFKSVPKSSFAGSTFPNSYSCPMPPATITGLGIHNFSANKYGHFVIHHTRYYVKNRLVNIRFNGGRINYEWGSNRLDSYNDKILNSIKIYSKEDGIANANKLIDRFDFNFDYFDSGCTNNYECKRLRLKEVKELNKPSYNFSYFDENSYFPPVTSNKKDYLGYYNGDVTHPENSHITPNLFFYPFKQEYSILPFHIPNQTSYNIPGDYDDDTPLLSEIRKWSLSAVRYPTGAITELDYELNEVNIFNQSVLSSGLRLSAMKITDEGNTIRNINYTYTKLNNKSSGTFVNPPDFGKTTLHFNSPNSPQFSQWNSSFMYDTFIINQYPKIDMDLNSGNYITYSRVKEEEIGNGYSIYEFTSNNLYPNQYNRSDTNQQQLNLFTGNGNCNTSNVLNNSSWGIGFYTDNSYKRSKLLSKKVYNFDNVLLQETINTYSENLLFNIDVYKKRLFKVNTIVPSDNGDYGNVLDVAKAYKQNTFKLKSTKTIDHYNMGNVESNLTEYEYNGIGLVSSVKKSANSGITFINNDPQNQTVGEFNIDNSKYVADINIQESGISFLQSINYLSDLVERNRIFKITVAATSDIDEEVNGFRKQYKSNGFIDRLLVGDKEGNYEDEILFDSYNNRGKPTQFRDKQGKMTALFWSRDLLIAKIENESYTTIKNFIQSMNGFNTDNCESNNCAQYFSENLRSAFPEALVYTYAYESSLENPISVTDAKNETVYYEYDNIGRLIKVRDKNGNLLNVNDYNFKLPN